MFLTITGKIGVSLIVLSTVALLLYANAVEGQPTPSADKLVHAGGGNATSVVLSFLPEKIEISAGQSITWDNPTAVAEPHSVTFIKNDKFFADFVSPFNVPNSTQFQSPQPDTNSEPIFVPSSSSDSKTVMTINSRALNPVVIDAQGSVTNLEPNGNYTMNGNENYINSGWLWPNGLAPLGGPALNNFTITFEKAGEYSYVCNVHPWMTGQVTVK
jgi:plastocyanin